MSVTVKTAGAVSATPGGFTAVASTPDLDRDGEIIDPGAFSPLPKSVPLLAFHDRAAPIGVCRPRYDEGGRLMIDATFASTARAQEVRQLVKDGAATSVSVGFIIARRTKDKSGVVHIAEAELLEVSVVAIPSNRAAVITAQRSPKAKRLAVPVDRGVLASLRADIALTRAGMQSERPTRREDPFARSGFTPSTARTQKEPKR